MIRVDALVVRYPGMRVAALDGVSFEALPGRITAVVGPNGSGKSTFVRTLVRRVAPTSGRILIDGIATDRLNPRGLAQRVSVVPQREEPVFPMQVRDLVALGRYPHGGAFTAPTAEDREAVAQAIVRADIAALVDRSTDTLSGGEWQRVRIARALAQGGQAIVLDEPTTYLDIAHEMAVFELCDTLARQGLCVILVSHQLNLVARFADQIVLLHQGRVAAEGSPNEVMRGDVLERVYEWPLIVSRDPAVGAPVLLPLRHRGTR